MLKIKLFYINKNYDNNEGYLKSRREDEKFLKTTNKKLGDLVKK